MDRRKDDIALKEIKDLLEGVLQHSRDSVPETLSALIGDLQKRQNELRHELLSVYKSHVEEERKWKEELDIKLKKIEDMVFPVAKAFINLKFLKSVLLASSIVMGGLITWLVDLYSRIKHI